MNQSTSTVRSGVDGSKVAFVEINMRILFSILSLIILWSPASAQNTGEVNVTLHENYTKRLIMQSVARNVDGKTINENFDLLLSEIEINGVIRCKTTNCSPSTFSAYDNNRLRASLELQIKLNNIPNFSTTFDLIVRFICNSAQPELGVIVDAKNIDIQLGELAALVFPQLRLLTEPLKAFLSSVVSEEINDEVSHLNQELNNSNLALPRCPIFRAITNGDLVMDFTHGTECEGNEVRRAACPTGFIGSGTAVICVDGWLRTSVDCEPEVVISQ